MYTRIANKTDASLVKNYDGLVKFEVIDCSSVATLLLVLLSGYLVWLAVHLGAVVNPYGGYSCGLMHFAPLRCVPTLLYTEPLP